VATVIIGEPQVDKSEAQAFLYGERVEPPTTILDAQGNAARRVTISPHENRVLSVEPIPASLVPFILDDVQAAWNLASRDPAIRNALGDSIDRFKIVTPEGSPGEPFVVESLPLRSVDLNDACSRNRCLDLIFRTENGYLPVRAHVDLTAQTFAVHGSQQ
jgi:hypothetical protein